MKRFIILTIIFTFASLLKVSAEKWYSLEQPDNGYFNHIDGAFTAGTTGLGFDLAFPLKDWGRLRVGGVLGAVFCLCFYVCRSKTREIHRNGRKVKHESFQDDG